LVDLRDVAGLDLRVLPDRLRLPTGPLGSGGRGGFGSGRRIRALGSFGLREGHHREQQHAHLEKLTHHSASLPVDLNGMKSETPTLRVMRFWMAPFVVPRG